MITAWKLRQMKAIFEQLEKLPLQTRREIGLPCVSYQFAVQVCDSLLEKRERETARIKRFRAKKAGARRQ